MSGRSVQSHRRLMSSRSGRRSSIAPRPQSATVSRDDAYTFALRVGYLHYLLQPKAKRKQYVPSTKPPPPRSNTGGISHLVAELAPGSTGSLKLPHGFRIPLEKRMEGVLRGAEKLPGYNDPAVKRSFAEAYTAFTDKNFQKTIDKERKLESLVLIFYSSAVKVAQKGRSDDAWKLLPDRHAALFIRLVSSILKDGGHDREKAELMSRLKSLESKLLTNDQDLVQDGGGTTIEVVVPLSFLVKDMPVVQLVARIFNVSADQAQADVDSNMNFWTEEAALKDLKLYQNNLNSDLPGALRQHDFEDPDVFEDWKKSETQYLSHMMFDILTANPELARFSNAPPNVPNSRTSSLTTRPRSMFAGADDRSFSDLNRVLSNESSGDQSMNFNALSLADSRTIRSVNETTYTFIPPNPRQYYKAVLQEILLFEKEHRSESLQPDQPISDSTFDLLTELSVRWRIPQSSRLVTFAEVIVQLFSDQQLDGEQLDSMLEYIKTSPSEPKKLPHIQDFTTSLLSLDPQKWTVLDTTVYQQTLSNLHDGLLRDLYTLLLQCYDPQNPSIGVVMHNLKSHVVNEPEFTPDPSEMDNFSNSLMEGLQTQAKKTYRNFINENLPSDTQDWTFLHIVGLGKAVTKLCERIRKRYSKNPEVMGVSPLKILVETMFPSFEEDASSIIQTIIQNSRRQDAEVHIQDGFDLYHELVAIRRLHQTFLRDKPFIFDIETLMSEFVWRFIREAESDLELRIEEAIKLDPFQVRTQMVDALPDDSQRHSSSVMDIFMLFNATVNQIIELEWENPVNHAQFMTALSRSFAAGVGKYCEILEQRFAKEMDRPTAQDLAASSRTTQERFLQYAKDAWTTKEKPEPFQFYAESFVKLNNIEYAMQQMDKLETSMNVDACAQVIEKAEGPRKTARKPNKYVFTVKIVEGEDLKACDSTGTSDPYVILGDELRKRLYKTRIVYRSLNPRWDESIDIAAQGPMNLVATIWDYDTFGEHDCVGRTSLKLDPVHFSDYLPREFWLDLDTQGRILLRVSMEGERDDIQFWFGKAFRYLKRTERDMVRKITDKLSTQINDILSRDTLRSLLKTGGIGASFNSLWKKGSTNTPVVGPTEAEVEGALMPLFNYFNDNFAIMNQTLARATMDAVMARLWKEVLMALESLMVPPLSEKPSSQRPLNQKELDIVNVWLNLLFEFFHAKDQSGEILGVPAAVLKSPKYLELVSLNFFYFDSTDALVKESERIALNNAQRTQQALMSTNTHNNRLSAPPMLGQSIANGIPFASMGTIRRGKSVMLSRNLGTMRRVKEEKRKEAQAEQNDDMILRILRMRPEAAGFLKERHRQKERQAATAAAAMIVKNSVSQGWNSMGSSMGMAAGYEANSILPRR